MENRVIHLWETFEITLYAENKYENYYTEVCVWAHLKGPGFDKKCFGFWDGNNVFRIRVTATAPGLWTYSIHSNVQDKGLTGITGAFVGIPWTEEEKQEIQTRRGIVRASENGHALEYGDGTPFVMVGDTWWGLASYRYPWEDSEEERPIGSGMSMKDMARQRIRQGFNTVGMIAAFPTWADDGEDPWIMLDDGHETTLRNAWTADGSSRQGARNHMASCKAMHNEGGRPFFFPGKIAGYEHIVPDYDRINPEYFKVLDKKIDWLNKQGITVFIETLRRDCSKTWKYYYDWPMVYTRYIQYIFARYQTNNCIFSPIHFDIKMNTIDSREFNEPINLFIDTYGKPPFGTLMGTNPSPSTHINYGGPEEQHWLSFHQIGNWREHENYWYLTDIYHTSPPSPAINGEPYYSGYPESAMKIDENGNTVTELGTLTAESQEDHLNCRSGYYGSVLSGAYGGVLAGFEGCWGANVEEGNVYNIWDTMTFPVSYQVRYVRDFLLSEGSRYQELIPNADLVTPNKAGEPYGYRGWAFASATPKRDLILGYVEKDCPRTAVRALRPYEKYEFQWFDPCCGKWGEKIEVRVNSVGMIPLPEYPQCRDWAFKLKKSREPYSIDTSEHPKTCLEEYRKQKGEKR
ncbi:MAG: DUF5060 domain-containing protein [Blautia sp.]